MSDTAEQLRLELAHARPSHNAAGYPPGLRDRVSAWLADQRDQGASWNTLGGQLGISRTTARDWAQRASSGEAEERAFLPVSVECVPPRVPPRGPVLVSPRGYRVEGLDVDLLVDVLERLG